MSLESLEESDILIKQEEKMNTDSLCFVPYQERRLCASKTLPILVLSKKDTIGKLARHMQPLGVTQSHSDPLTTSF